MTHLVLFVVTVCAWSAGLLGHPPVLGSMWRAMTAWAARVHGTRRPPSWARKRWQR